MDYKLKISLIVVFLTVGWGGFKTDIRAQSATDWPQLGQNAKRTNSTSVQVDPPYCYTWKWFEAPLASRTQPVISENRLFLGSMNGILYARNAATGAALWQYQTGGPIRNSAAVLGATVMATSHDGYTYAVEVVTGTLKWKTLTGPANTAPLIDSTRNQVYVASTNGKLTALTISTGGVVWQYDSGAPIMTSPSTDGTRVFIGNEAIYAIAVNPDTGAQLWKTRLEGQSLSDRYPVVSGNTVMYRSQPNYYFYELLHEGDAAMDEAGTVLPDWTADWNLVRPKIVNYLTIKPTKQTFFVLNTSNGTKVGVAPVLWTYGNNDIPNVPVVSANNDIYLTYRARHGIQTDTPTVHVSSKYDAELGKINLSTLDITGLTANQKLSSLQFRMTSDEPAMLTLSGNNLLVDSWERLGGLNVSTHEVFHAGAVMNGAMGGFDCDAPCGPGTVNPVIPLTPGGQSVYPNGIRTAEGRSRAGAVVAGNLIYWKFLENGIAAMSHQSGSSCAAPLVYNPSYSNPALPTAPAAGNRAFGDYIDLDLTTAATNPPADLVARLKTEISEITATNDHLMPFMFRRGLIAGQTGKIWPYNSTNSTTEAPGIYNTYIFWQDPGELIYTMAMAYPYLDTALQTQVKNYVSAEINRFSPLTGLPWSDTNHDWLRSGAARERYTVADRSSMSIWPPPDVNLNVIYGLWLWAKNSGDWSYVQSNYATIKSIYNDKKGKIKFYSDIAGIIGFGRIAKHFNNTADLAEAKSTLATAMQTGLNFSNFVDTAANFYPDSNLAALAPVTTAYYAQALYGLTPEVGLYLAERLGAQVRDYLYAKETGVGMINNLGLNWWYLTRVGIHGENFELSYLTPFAGWSHYLGQAYVMNKTREELRNWLDIPWGKGDLYSIQRVVATIQAKTSGTVPTATPTVTVKPGDANNDGYVNAGDLAIWLSHYLQSVSGRSNGDFNNDATVNGADYYIWYKNYGL